MSERGVLPPALEARLLEATQPDPGHKLEAMDAATIRERVLKRIRSTPALTTIQADEGEWAPFSPKVSIKVLRRDVETQSYLLRLEPGAVVLPHIHDQDFHMAPKGVVHDPICSEFGALLFLRGAIPSASQVRWGRAAAHALTAR